MSATARQQRLAAASWSTVRLTAERRRRERRGRLAEIAAAAWLTLKGYRIVERRHKSPCGEIDLIAVRGRRMAFVEVKLRGTLALAEASITPRQGRRVRAAAERWVWSHARYRDHEIGIDVVLLDRWFRLRHREQALQDDQCGRR